MRQSWTVYDDDDWNLTPSASQRPQTSFISTNGYAATSRIVPINLPNVAYSPTGWVLCQHVDQPITQLLSWPLGGRPAFYWTSITADLMTGAICSPCRIGMTRTTTHSMTSLSLLSSAPNVVAKPPRLLRP